MTVNVPEVLYQKAAESAASQHVSVDEVFQSALREQIAAWERLQRRAA